MDFVSVGSVAKVKAPTVRVLVHQICAFSPADVINGKTALAFLLDIIKRDLVS